MKCKHMSYLTFTRITILFGCLFLLTGCWNSRELDELGIAVALGIDKTDEDLYHLSVQVINPSEIATDAPTTRPPVSTYSTSGKTVLEAFRKLTKKTPRKIYFSQLRLLVLGTKISEEGIMPILDFLYRDHEYRTSFYVVVAKNAAVGSILSIITPYEKIPANKVMNSIDNAEKHWAATKGVSIDKLISAIRSPGEDPVLSGILMEGEENIGTNIRNVENVDAPTKLEVDNLGVFKKDQLIGWLTEEQSQGLIYATGNVNSTVITHPCKEKEGSLSAEIIRSQASMKAELKGNKPTIKIKVEAEGNVGEVDCKIDLSKPESIEKINKEVDKGIEKVIHDSVQAAQEFGTDVFGFGNVVHRDHPKYFKTVEN
jgi:spore germination protein KC